MKTKLVFHDGNNRLEIECPDGRMARQFIQRYLQPGYTETVEVVREIHRLAPASEIIEAFNSDDDTFARNLRQHANIRVQAVKVKDPGSVAGHFFG